MQTLEEKLTISIKNWLRTIVEREKYTNLEQNDSNDIAFDSWIE